MKCSAAHWLWLLVLGAVLFGVSGCTTNEPENASARPWNTPQGWEAGSPMMNHAASVVYFPRFNAARRRQNKIHLQIVRFYRNFAGDLFIESDAAFQAAGFPQQAIIKSPAATQPVAAQIKRHAWNENQIQPVQNHFSAKPFRFADAKLSGDNFILGILHAARGVSLIHRFETGQGGDFFVRGGFFQQRPHVRLVRQRREKQDRGQRFPRRIVPSAGRKVARKQSSAPPEQCPFSVAWISFRNAAFCSPQSHF